MAVEVDFELGPWQGDIVSAWKRGDRHGPFRGTLEVFTGGGKTLMALEGWAEVTRERASTRLAVVVPTEALAHEHRHLVRMVLGEQLGRRAIDVIQGTGRRADRAAMPLLPSRAGVRGRTAACASCSAQR